MPWCPKCKSEYEKGVEVCKQCQVDLIDNLEDYVEYVPLVEIDPQTAEGLIEYLNYSGIQDYKVDEKEDCLEISVNKKDLKRAKTHLSVYVYNLKQATDEDTDTYENEISEETEKEYETSTMLDGDKVKGLRSSGITYYVLGAGILAFTYFNMKNILNVINPAIEGIFLFAGISLVGLGYITFKKIPDAQVIVAEVQDKVEAMISWYENSYSLDKFYEEKNINTDEHDEGAIYYVILDIIKADLLQQFPEEDTILINNAAEEIYSKI